MTTDKVEENRIRRVAERRGYALQKSRRRDTLAIDYGGFMLVDAAANAVVFGATPHPFSASLAEVATFLDSPTPSAAPAKRRRAKRSARR